MKVDLQPADTWESLNEVYRQALDIPTPGPAVRAYLGCFHAVWEIGLGLAQLFPHRKAIAYFKNAGPYFDALAVALSREGYTVRALSEAEMREPKAWFEELQKDLLFVLKSADDPITGELFEFNELDALMKENRVFKITLSHSRHFYRPLPAKPALYEIEILSLRTDRTLAILGDRARINSPVAAGLPWPRLSIADARTQLKDGQENEAAVRAFEASSPGGAEAYFKDTRPRLSDRAVLYWSDMDGFSFITELAAECGWPLEEPGREVGLETSSRCRWGARQQTDWLESRGVAPETLRGLVIIAAELITPELPAKIETVRRRLLEQQQG